MAKPKDIQAHRARIDRVVAHIHENLDAPLDMDRLGEVACLSTFHWHRIYREIMGETARRTIARRRLWRAAHQLLHSDARVAEIAQQAHYGSVSAFSRAFVKEYGVAPARYRMSKGLGGDVSLSGDQANRFSIRKIEPLQLVGMDHKGPHYEIGRTFDRLFAWARVTPGVVNADTKGVAVYFDNPALVPDAEQRSFAGIPAPKCDLDLPRQIGRYLIPGGLHAIARHVGPYTELGSTYGKLFQEWLPASGYEVTGAPCFEINENDPKVAAPSDFITDIYLPVR